MRHNEYDEVEEFDEVEDVEEDLAFSLTDQFYIRRNGKVKGPMDAKRIRKLVKSKKLKPSDEVSLSVDGSWDRLSNAYKDIISGNYVDGTAAKLPPRMSNRKKKVAKPLDGVEWLGSEWHVARMAMYQKYRTTLHITAGVVLFIIVVGVPILWIAGTDFWGVVYENKPAASDNAEAMGKDPPPAPDVSNVSPAALAALDETADRWLKSFREWLNRKDVLTEFGSMQNPDLMSQTIATANYKWGTDWINGNDPTLEIIEMLQTQASVNGKADWTVSLVDANASEINFDVTYQLKEVKSMWPGTRQLKSLEAIREKLIGESDTIRLKIPVEHLDGGWRVPETKAKLGWIAGFGRKMGSDLFIPSLNVTLRGLAESDLGRIGGADTDEMRKFNVWCAIQIRAEIDLPTKQFLDRPDVTQAFLRSGTR